MELLYDRLAGRAFGLAYRILRDSHSAEDVVQEAFLCLWRDAHRLSSDRGSVTSLLMTMVHHKAVDLLRARRGRAADPLPLDTDGLAQQSTADVIEAVTNSLGRDAVRQALGSLPDEQRRPMLMAYFEGLTHVEIAEALGIPLGTVKSRLRLGLEKMRTALGFEPPA